MASDDRITVKNKVKKMIRMKKTIVVYFKVLTQHLPGGTEEYH
jgi:hypothetical protein